VAIEAWQGLLDAIEPPAGKPFLIGCEGEKQVQPKVLGPQLSKDALAPEAMVNPRK
jgi:hypothetical protein